MRSGTSSHYFIDSFEDGDCYPRFRFFPLSSLSFFLGLCSPEDAARDRMSSL